MGIPTLITYNNLHGAVGTIVDNQQHDLLQQMQWSGS